MNGEPSMQPRYDPHGVEERWQERWEDEGLYAADPDPSRPPYVDAHPPPNVTGELHMGHALQLALGDTLSGSSGCRATTRCSSPATTTPASRPRTSSRRPCSRRAPRGSELGREAFEERVWEWLEEYGGKIICSSAGWAPRSTTAATRFTMDDGYVRAVMRFFVHLYRRGWIYRANRIINWCPFHQTSLSDLELEHEDADDTLIDDPLPARGR